MPRQSKKAKLPPGIGLSTRASNKNAHPGVPDLPNARRSTEEMATIRRAEAQKQEAAAALQAASLAEVAAIENQMDFTMRRWI
ncbi:hypothetical protein A0H81_10300 [Grifola frondosa]|uniref:Uncharacterized protein n=1 Tax=Grifola frondosa TaxID=5627 RepID=A0A1C7LXZ1_GRIFR|nr:hypothetical protein A0H81_10300 [Grifola frondosa]